MGKFIDLTGNKFGRLTVLHRVDDHVTSGGGRKVQWLCRCECGNETIVQTMNLRCGDTKSCGCFETESKSITHKTHGDSKSRLYRIWSAMKKRCYNENFAEYDQYGGRGIYVCDEWKDDYESFKSWAINNGYSDDLTIERYDVNKCYCPDNCGWENMRSQSNNKTNNIIIQFNGESHTISEWSNILGIKYCTLYNRLVIRKLSTEIAFKQKLK